MPTATVYNASGAQAESIELPDSVFGAPDNPVLVHQAVVVYEAALRAGTASTKTRGEVSGSGAKPWRQKGTGRARFGSVRTNIWRGGATTFGPKPRSFRLDMPRKARLAALRSALSSRLRTGKVKIVDGLVVREGKTREVAEMLANLGVAKGESCLIAVAEKDEAFILASRNIPNLLVKAASDINAYDVMRPRHVLIAKEALGVLTERLGR